MKKRTVGIIIATIVTVLLFGIPGVFIALSGGLTALLSYMPSSTTMLSLAGSNDTPNIALLSGLGSCCVCIPIPLFVGFFAWRQQVNASATSVGDEPPSSVI